MDADQLAFRLLKKQAIFSGLSPDLLRTLAHTCRVKYADPGELLIDEAWPVSPGLYIVTHGEVQVERRMGEERVILSHNAGGNSFGELSLLDGLPPSATVKAITDVEAVLLPREEFLTCLDKSRSLSRAIMKVLARRLRESNEGRVVRQTKDLRSRLAAEMLQLAQRQAPDLDNPTIRLEESQAELARKLGVTREAVNRALKSLSEGDPAPLTPRSNRRGAFSLDLVSLRKAAS